MEQIECILVLMELIECILVLMEQIGYKNQQGVVKVPLTKVITQTLPLTLNPYKGNNSNP